MRLLAVVASSTFVAAGVLSACNDDSRTPPATPDAGSDATGVTDATPSDRPDAATAPIRCSEAELAEGDRTDGGPLTIVFGTGANPKQYENRCLTVKAGTTVTFSGSFLQHPLEPAGGDSPSPIPYTAEDQPGGSLSVTMTRPGTFGFQCEFHRTSMFGAIRVVP